MTINAVSPSALGDSTSAPALRSFSIMSAFPMTAASDMGVAPEEIPTEDKAPEPEKKIEPEPAEQAGTASVSS